MRTRAAARGAPACLRRVLALLLLRAAVCSASFDTHQSSPPATLGWAHGADASLLGQSGCTVDRRAVAELSQDEFDAVYQVRGASSARVLALRN